MKTNYNSYPIRMAKEYKQALEAELQLKVAMNFTTICGVLYAIYSVSGIKFEEIAILW